MYEVHSRHLVDKLLSLYKRTHRYRVLELDGTDRAALSSPWVVLWGKLSPG